MVDNVSSINIRDQRTAVHHCSVVGVDETLEITELLSKLDVVSQFSELDVTLSNIVVACEVVRELSFSSCRSKDSERTPWKNQQK